MLDVLSGEGGGGGGRWDWVEFNTRIVLLDRGGEFEIDINKQDLIVNVHT